MKQGWKRFKVVNETNTKNTAPLKDSVLREPYRGAGKTCSVAFIV
jgi:hypothetical protein